MRRYFLILMFAIASLSMSGADFFAVNNLTADNVSDPLGVVNMQPRLSWQLHDSRQGSMQTAYQIIVASTREKANEGVGDVWDSGRQQSGQSLLVPYGGAQLTSATTYYWRVRAWNNSGAASEWSEVARFTMGLPEESNWMGAKWIAYEPDDTIIVPAIHSPLIKKTLGQKKTGMYRMPQFRRAFSLKKSVKEALVYVVGLGHFDLFINGKKGGNHFLDPGWTAYQKEAQYVTFDVTQQLVQGGNVMGLMLGNGFYNQPRERYNKLLGSFGAPKARLRMVVRYTDGTEENIVTNSAWKAAPSAITFSSIYGGEDYDAQQEQAGWNSDYKFNDKKWTKALEVEQDIRLLPQLQNAVRVNQQIPPVSIFRNQQGQWVYDLGQNFSGIVSIAVSGQKGKEVILRPAELIFADSTANQKATGKQYYFKYTLRGDSIETWQPQFSYYGFRYVQLEGAVPEGKDNPDGLPVVSQLNGLHMSSVSDEAGTFSCSNPLFNKVHNLIDWAIRSNIYSVTTDCPHREKLGWQEQNHLMQWSMMYRYNLASLYNKIMNDLEAAQNERGMVPTIAPEYVHFDDGSGFEDTPEWGSAFIICPWYAYEAYGDMRLIEEHFPAMQRYMDYFSSRAQNGILDYGLGDWYDIGPGRPGFVQLTTVGCSATAMYYYDAVLMSKMAQALGKSNIAQKYDALAKDIRKAFNDKYVTVDAETGTVSVDKNSQTAYAMALFTGVIDDNLRQGALQGLVNDIESRQYALTAGDVGYRYVLRALTEEGRDDIIYKMNSRYDVPGYGWQLAHDATALTESWQAYGNVSNNHLMLGHLMEWLYGGIGGIRNAPQSVGFKEVMIDPRATDGVSSANTSYATPYGTVQCKWSKSCTTYKLSVSIPANTTALVTLPATSIEQITNYGVPLKSLQGISIASTDATQMQLRVGSGDYSFEVK